MSPDSRLDKRAYPLTATDCSTRLSTDAITAEQMSFLALYHHDLKVKMEYTVVAGESATYKRAFVVEAATALDLDGLFGGGKRRAEGPIFKAQIRCTWCGYNRVGQRCE